MRDLMNHIDPKPAIAPAVVTDNTAQVSSECNLQGCNAAMLVIATGTLADADATFTVLMEESDSSGSGFTAVDDADLIGTEALASFTFAADGVTRKIGYIGNKQYIRATITPAANASGAPLAAVWLRSMLSIEPAANPPA